jgi:hypothetical protein
LLAHHPATQQRIDKGLTEAAQLESMTRRAFKLHELIEKVRQDLRPAEPEKILSMPRSQTDEPPLAKGLPEESSRTPSKSTEQVLEQKFRGEGALDTHSPDGPVSLPELRRGVSGRVYWQGKPAVGVVLNFVTRGTLPHRIYETCTESAGVYWCSEVQPGRYTVLLTPGRYSNVRTLPERYALTNTSPLLVEVGFPGDRLDLVLK